MLITDMLTWWYGAGWAHVLSSARHALRKLYYSLSVKQMLRTLFAPWKEDHVEGGQGMDQMMRALVMNSVARLIGFFIRMIFIIFWLVTSLVLGLATLALLVIWPLMPALPVLALGYGVRGFI